MSKEWYLMKSPYDQLSGFEDDALLDFAQEGFEEIQASEMAETVELYNYDLSECQQLRVVIQDKVTDTKLKTLSRLMLARIGSCKAGMYVKYKNRFWLIVGLVDDNKMYEKAVLSLCNYLLTWINKEGKIIQRWVNAVSASQYNNGETSTRYYYLRSDQLLIIAPDDDECILLQQGDRFIIDKRCKIYERAMPEDATCDTSNPVITYEITRVDSVLYDYQDSGHSEFMVTETEQHKEDGFYRIDGKGYWLCKCPQIDDKTALLSTKIKYETNEICNGLEPCVFVARFFDESGKIVEGVEAEWSIECDFKDKLDIEQTDNSISIFVDDKSLLNKSLKITLSADGYEPSTVTAYIRAFL